MNMITYMINNRMNSSKKITAD
ncbi:MAG: hypothetical protein EZS26_003353, partial [Candidatus Ordinivivax streblomastigis]